MTERERVYKKMYMRRYRQKNLDRIREYDRKRKADKSPQELLKARLRTRLYLVLKDYSSCATAIKFLGCTHEFLCKYLESQFKPGMTWENYGRKGWHVDHIKPLASFNLTNAEDLKQACHFTNLQPMWALDNLQKGSKV